MANFFFLQARTEVGDGDLKFTADTMKICLVSADVTLTRDGFQTLSDIPSGERLYISGALTGKTQSDLVFDADDPTMVAPTAGDPATQFVVFKDDAGDPATSTLFAKYDIASQTLDGTDFTIRFSNGAYKMGRM